MMFRRRSKSMADDCVLQCSECSLQCMGKRQDVEQDVRDGHVLKMELKHSFSLLMCNEMQVDGKKAAAKLYNTANVPKHASVKKNPTS